MRARLSLFLLLTSCGLSSAEAPGGYLGWSPRGRAFSCEIPRGWSAFEEEEPQGFAAHFLGPDDPAGTYRAGIDVHWVERGQPGWVDWKDAVDRLRRPDKESRREATPVRLLRVGGVLSRVFEVTESRRLPPDHLPAAEEALHHYVAIVPGGESYYIIRLSSTRDVYLEYKEEFLRFLKSFRP